MSIAGLLHEAALQGITFRLEAGVVRMSAAAPPAPDLLSRLRQHREGIAALLAEEDHDAAEAEAMRAHYAEPAGPDPPASDPLKDGLFRGFWLHRHLSVPDRKA